MAIYQDVKKELIHRIHEGDYKAGEKIPSERDLSLVFKVSRMTIRQALSELVAEGVLYKSMGRGTFVSSPSLYQENLKSFTQTLIGQGMVPSTKVIEIATISQVKKISQWLNVDPMDSYYKVKRLRLGDGVPIALETIYIPKKYAEGIHKHDLTSSLYKILEKKYGYDLTHITCDIEANISSRIIMEAMGLNKQTALLKITGITYAQNDLKLFYEESYYRSQLYKYHVDILNRP
ncbi:GntR family transcriptional regulator [Petrocella sp. FN5]|uniref:GntR family transcriptional regulator n=1 Tax=Petrocella sp. FN5 TaxID=3032002 RepID=UPI0023DA9595|nr:GntR family transcriptional regulator [Petrocella sp. FN5]MDF1616451.1 GntR family transcriptional regulator [Petrocella sp. FN5]